MEIKLVGKTFDDKPVIAGLYDTGFMANSHKSQSMVFRFPNIEVADSDQDNPQTEIECLADKFGVRLVSAEENARANGEYRNNMASAGSTIFLNAFDDPELELVAFFHELGHIELERSPYFHQKVTFCKISQEALAWEIGFSLAMAEGYNWEYHSKQKCYARDRLKSYVNYEGDWGGFR